MKSGNRKGRPNYPLDFKRQLAAAACEAGISVSKLAQANKVNANMVFKWRRELRAGLFDRAAQGAVPLLPVVLVTAPQIPHRAAAVRPAQTTAPGIIEIAIADAVVRVHGSADATLLRMIFQSLRS